MKYLLLSLMIFISACSHIEQQKVMSVPKAIINDQSEADQLLGKHLFTNQRLSSMYIFFGTADIANDNGVYNIHAEHMKISGEHLSLNDGYLRLDGVITEIGKDFFIVDGEISRLYVNEATVPCQETGKLVFSRKGHSNYWRYKLVCLNDVWGGNSLDYVDIFTKQEK